MLARLFRSNRQAVLLALLLLVPALFLPGLWHMEVLSGSTMPFYGWVAGAADGIGWLPGVIAIIVVLICSIQLASLANSADLLGQRTHLPALLFPLFLAVLAQGRVLEPALLGMPLVLAALARIWSIATASKVLASLFDAGLLIGLAALFHLPYAFLLVVAWASISVIRPFHWREYVLPVVGVALPLYFAWVIDRLFGQDTWRPMLTVLSGLAPELREASLPVVLHWILRLVLLLLTLVSLLTYAAVYQRGIMREKNLQASFMAFFFASAVLIAMSTLLEGSYPPVLLAAPLAVFNSHAVRGTKRAWLSELAVLVLLLAALWNQWG